MNRGDSMEYAQEYAEMAVSARFDDLSSHTVEMTKRFVLDALGVGIAGSAADESVKAVELVRDWGGKKEGTLLFFGDKLPSVHAVFANSVMIHALDFDDTHDGAVVHAYVTCLPAALAVAERQGRVTGKDFVLALNLGLDLTCRLGLAIGNAPGFASKPVHYIRSAVCGGFGASLTAGKLMGFSKDRLVNALGIVLSQVGGTRQVVVDSAMTKRLQPAFAAKAGVLSALLSDAGVGGCHRIFEGDYGFFNSYWGGDYERSALTRDLGSHFEGVNLSFKPYPCCRYNHGAIDAALACAQENAILAEDVQRVTVHLPRQKFYDVVSRPFVIGDYPTIDGQFSIPYTVASALIDGYVSLDTFRPARVRENRRKELADRVEVVMDQPVSDTQGLGPVSVDIMTQGGGVYSYSVDHFKGSPENPMSREACADKFKRCAAYAGNPFSEKTLNRCIDLIFSLDAVEDAGEIVKHFVRPKQGCVK